MKVLSTEGCIGSASIAVGNVYKFRKRFGNAPDCELVDANGMTLAYVHDRCIQKVVPTSGDLTPSPCKPESPKIEVGKKYKPKKGVEWQCGSFSHSKNAAYIVYQEPFVECVPRKPPSSLHKGSGKYLIYDARGNCVDDCYGCFFPEDLELYEEPLSVPMI